MATDTNDKDKQEKRELSALEKQLKKLFGGKYAVLIVLAAGILMLSIGFGDVDLTGALTGKQEKSLEFANELERRMVSILSSIDGVGDVNVMITTREAVVNDRYGSQAVMKDASPVVEGVIIVAEGASDAVVRQRISEAAIAALSVKPHKLQVFTLKVTEKER